MYSRGGGRQFSRGGHTQGGRRRFRGQYVRSRMSPSNHQEHQDDSDHYGQQPSSLNSLQNQHQQNQHQQSNNHNHNHHHQQQQEQQFNRDQQQRSQNRNSQHDIEDIKDICLKLASELNLVKSHLAEVSGNLEQMRLQQQRQPSSSAAQNNSAPTTATTTTTEPNGRKKKTKLLRRRNKSERDQQNNVDGGDRIGASERNTERRKRNQRSSELKEKPLPPRPNDDSTTQAADPSSEDKLEGENGVERVKRVIRRRKQNPNRRGYNRRNRMDSSERNSNDTSPQNEADEEEYHRPQKSRNGARSYPELTDAEMNEIIQAMTRDFLASEMESVIKVVAERSPAVARQFATAILDYAICDVTSPTKLGEIANNLSQAVIEGGKKFERGFTSALTDLSKREEDVAIDAPRYMDTLGQVLGQCLVPLNTGRNKGLMKQFLRQSVYAYGKKSGHKLYASILRALASCKSERYASQIYGFANLSINPKLWDDEFQESQEIKFLSKSFSPEPRENRRTPAELEKFADDITDLVEKGCTPQKLEGLVRDLELESDERVDYLGTLLYAIVRGCLITDSGEYKLDTEALTKYSILIKNPQYKKELQDAIALHALTALTKLWHSYNCPQNLMSNILLALHSHGAASYDTLKTWLNSDDLKNIPGIGAARLNSKRCIEDLGAVRG